MGAIHGGLGGFLSPSCRLAAHFQSAYSYPEVPPFFRRTLVFAFLLVINSSDNLPLLWLTDSLTRPSPFSSASPVASFFVFSPDLPSPSRSPSFFSFSSLKPLNSSSPQGPSAVCGNAEKPAHYLRSPFLKPSFVPFRVLPSFLWCGSCAGVSPFSPVSIHPRTVPPLYSFPKLHVPSSSTFLGRTSQYGSSRLPLHGFNSWSHFPRHFSLSKSPPELGFSSFVFPGLLSRTLWPRFSTNSSQSPSLLAGDLLHSCAPSSLLFKSRRDQADTVTVAGSRRGTDCMPRGEEVDKRKERLPTQHLDADLPCISVTLSNNICALAKAETRTSNSK